MAGEQDLGSKIPDTQPAAEGGGWTEFLKSPFFQGMAQQLAGGYAPGGALRQIGPAVAKGMESENLTNELQYGRAQNEQVRGDRLSEGALNRASHEKQNERTAGSREESAYIRGQFSVDRANISALAKAHPSDILKYRTEARKIVEGTLGNISLDDATKTKMIEQKADEMYRSDHERGRVGVPSAGAPGPAATSASPSATGAVGAASPTPEKPAPTAQGTPEPDLQKLVSGKMGPQVQEKLKTPEGRAELIRMNPRLERQIKLYEMALGATGKP